jgi:2-desacetyl-2-hydroxyethyl bacteriochlorophyllide A dehydrogenase
MKALVYTQPRRVEYLDWPDPQLAAGDALVRIGAVSLCGSDVHGWLGHSRGRVPPLVLGHEMAGVVERVEGDAQVEPGQPVAVYPIIGCNRCSYCASDQEYICRRKRVLGLHEAGGCAQFLKVPARNLYPIADSMGMQLGSLVEPLSNALHFVSLAERERGPCAILGAGPIGLLMLQVARSLAFHPIAAVEVITRRSELARTLGADMALNPQEPGAAERLESFFGEDGCSVVFDAAGFSPTRQLALKLVRSAGLIVLAGLGEAETSFDCIELIRREVRVTGAYAYSRREFQQAIEWIGGGRVVFDGWVSEANLQDAQSVLEELAQANPERIKVVLRP